VPCIEVDVYEAAMRGVPVLRRMTGGGAVYHDLGNVNFTIVSESRGVGGVDYDRLLCPVVDMLILNGFGVTHSGRGVLRLGGAKITGSSATMWRGRTLLHGTVLYDANLGALHRLLRREAAEYGTNACVRSVPDVVANLSSFTNHGNVEKFMSELCYMLSKIVGIRGRWRGFSIEQWDRIRTIAQETTLTPEWNLGQSPDYSIDTGLYSLRDCDGRIASIESQGKEPDLKRVLVGEWHEPAAVLKALEAAGIVLPEVSIKALFRRVAGGAV